MNFSSLGHKFKLKYEISRNLKLWSFELTRLYCNKILYFVIFYFDHNFQTYSLQMKEPSNTHVLLTLTQCTR
jgi:hypothetical protein